MSTERSATESIHDEDTDLVFVQATSPRQVFEELRAIARKQRAQFICLTVNPGLEGMTFAIGTLGPLRASLQDPFNGSLARVISNSLSCTPF